MKSSMLHWAPSIARITLLTVSCLSFGACAAFRANVSDVNVEQTNHMTGTYDYSDMRQITESVVGDLLRSPFLGQQAQPPVMMIAGVQNRTSEYVDTKSLTDRMRTLLFQAGKVQFVNETRREQLLKEQGYQTDNATPQSQVAVGKQIGARYMLSGSFIQMEKGSLRQVRVSKTEVNYYKLTIEVTDLETGLMVWTTEKEFAREARKPIIGW